LLAFPGLRPSSLRESGFKARPAISGASRRDLLLRGRSPPSQIEDGAPAPRLRFEKASEERFLPPRPGAQKPCAGKSRAAPPGMTGMLSGLMSEPFEAPLEDRGRPGKLMLRPPEEKSRFLTPPKCGGFGMTARSASDRNRNLRSPCGSARSAEDLPAAGRRRYVTRGGFTTHDVGTPRHRGKSPGATRLRR
jgi:hypothetical protein